MPRKSDCCTITITLYMCIIKGNGAKMTAECGVYYVFHLPFSLYIVILSFISTVLVLTYGTNKDCFQCHCTCPFNQCNANHYFMLHSHILCPILVELSVFLPSFHFSLLSFLIVCFNVSNFYCLI